MKTVYILVGNIASGKSTYIKKQLGVWGGVVVSKDTLRKEFGNLIGIEYLYDINTETYIDEIIKLYFLAYCKLGVENIYIDETNMTYRGRAFYKNIAKANGYRIVAVVFKDYGEDIHVNKRMNAVGEHRHDGVSEETWRKVYREKKERYEEPTLDEGIDEVIYI